MANRLSEKTVPVLSVSKPSHLDLANTKTYSHQQLACYIRETMHGVGWGGGAGERNWVTISYRHNIL